MQDEIEKGRWFSQRHKETGALVLPNAWDPGSAIVMAEVGFPAIATTSAGMAFALGLPDGEWIGRTKILELCAAIVNVVSVPVTADLEAGYGSDPADVAATVHGAIGVGLVGCNIEDGTGNPDRPLFDIALACERIRAGSEAARSSRVPFVLNARTDPYLLRPGRNPENFAEAVKRANAYREAGADCLYVPGPMDPETIRDLVREIHGPLNVLAARGGKLSQLTVADLDRIGVRRITIGGSLSLAALALVRRAASEVKEHGTFSYAGQALSNVEVNGLMARTP